jgi:hypothetical protein
MSTTRRTFIQTSLAATASAALTTHLAAAPKAPAAARDYYELRCYHLQAGSRLKTDANPALLDRYLEQALLPALDKLGLKNTGVFTELDVNKAAGTSTPKSLSPVWLLVTHPTLESFVQVSATLNADPAVQLAGRDYLATPKTQPAFERIDTWLLRSFQGQPQMSVPPFSQQRSPTRVFEMRDYESYGELPALRKMAMFDEGEINLMQDLGLNPVCFGQALAGPDLPHLRYITSGPDLTTHLHNWSKFGPNPRWLAIKDLPRFADTVSKNTARFLTPKAYSQL